MATVSRNSSLQAARETKNDEFYTQWADIEREVNAYLEFNPDVFRDKVVLLPCDDPEWSNFTKFFALHFVDFGVKKLISTSYAPDSNPNLDYYTPTLFEMDDPKFDETKTHTNGKKFVLEPKDINGDGIVNIYRWAAIVGLRADNPMATIKAARRPKRAPRPISDESMRRLLAESDDQGLTAMLILGGYQGLRVSEIARMRGDLIDLDSRTLRVRGKGGHVVILPAHPRVLAVARRMPRGYWFPSQRGQHLGGRTISQRIRLHMIACRVGGTAHSLRHRFCTSMVEQGADIRVVQELARHSQLSTTALYVAATDVRQRAALEMLV